MSACEKCWREANHRALLSGGYVSDIYQTILSERQCDAEEQKFGEHLCAGCGERESECTCCGRCGHPSCGCDHEPLNQEPE